MKGIGIVGVSVARENFGTQDLNEIRGWQTNRNLVRVFAASYPFHPLHPCESRIRASVTPEPASLVVRVGAEPRPRAVRRLFPDDARLAIRPRCKMGAHLGAFDFQLQETLPAIGRQGAGF